MQILWKVKTFYDPKLYEQTLEPKYSPIWVFGPESNFKDFEPGDDQAPGKAKGLANRV